MTRDDTSRIDVLIVGSGPTGLTLAVDLARRGVSFRIVERDAVGRGNGDQPHLSGSRGKGLQPRTLEVFDDLGVIDEIRRTGAHYPVIRVYAGRVPVWKASMHKWQEPTDAVPYPMIMMQPQWRTEQILRDRLAELGGKVETGVELAEFTQDEDAVTAVLRDAAGAVATVRARYLVGADGGRSTIRKALGIGFVGETREEERMIIGDVRVEGLARDAWQVWINPWRRQLKVAVCPLPHTDTFQLTAPLAPGVEPDLSLAAFQRLFAADTGLRDARVTALTWASVYRVNIRMVDRYRVGRVFLAGDAAHVHSPAGGQGLNTGVQDAYNLGWKLGAVLGGAPESLLDTYEQERMPVAASILGLSTRLLDQANKGARKALKRDEETGQLLLNYRGGPLAVGERGGERAPDGRARLVDGTPVRLFDLFRGPHFTLLATRPVTAPEGVRVHVVRPGSLRGGYGGHAFHLVRPDGYLGVTTDSEGDLADYLARVAPGR
ncbi:FAD-dependent oxidoreductase [Catellatospora tritici]|uniref:FAD-dependent oxidoreductase n=1 Tax=Catellatospora tritici TaxID=2851566 RepID=UPI001C2CE4B7|nr:FAD-dependent oxidoreductase [Catellatospora tritici]MBV1852646.1 FAD-dependent oxidoreductase [Catellatospora tritici]